MWVVVGGGGMRPNTATSRSLLLLLLLRPCQLFHFLPFKNLQCFRLLLLLVFVRERLDATEIAGTPSFDKFWLSLQNSRLVSVVCLSRPGKLDFCLEPQHLTTMNQVTLNGIEWNFPLQKGENWPAGGRDYEYKVPHHSWCFVILSNLILYQMKWPVGITSVTRSGNEPGSIRSRKRALISRTQSHLPLVVSSQMIYLTVVRLAESSVSEVTGEQGRDTLDSPELFSVPPGGFSVSDWEVSLDWSESSWFWHFNVHVFLR